MGQVPKDVAWTMTPMRVSVTLNSHLQMILPSWSPSLQGGVGGWGWEVEALGRPVWPQASQGPGHQPFLAPEFLISINIYFLPLFPGS